MENILHYLTVVTNDRHLRKRFAKSSAGYNLVIVTNSTDRKKFLDIPIPLRYWANT